MEVILLEKIRRLGNLGDKVSVKSGYGRNYLIPQSKAVFATEKNIELFEQRRAELEKKAQQMFASAEQRAAKINDITLVIAAQASDEGKLYGSIGISEVKDALMARDFDISKREIIMPDGPFHAVGSYVIDIQLHSDVVANLQIDVVATK